MNNDQINNTTRNESIYNNSQQQQLNNQNHQTTSEDHNSLPENKDCANIKLMIGFKRTLMLPDVYFVADSLPMCFCDQCHKQNSCSTKGWVRFVINQQITNPTQMGNFGEDWMTAYCNTRVDKIRAVLDHSQPLPNSDLDFDSNYAASSSCNEDIVAGTHIILRFVHFGNFKVQSIYLFIFFSDHNHTWGVPIHPYVLTCIDI